MGDTGKIEENVQRNVLSSPPVACTTFASVCTGNSVKKSYTALKMSVVITVSTTCDLAIEFLDVRGVENLDVRVATIVVKKMKRKIEEESCDQ